jgi:hypothetical protein
LIEGGLIITAAHCLDWNCTGMMAMGEFCLERNRNFSRSSNRFHDGS